MNPNNVNAYINQAHTGRMPFWALSTTSSCFLPVLSNWISYFGPDVRHKCSRWQMRNMPRIFWRRRDLQRSKLMSHEDCCEMASKASLVSQWSIALWIFLKESVHNCPSWAQCRWTWSILILCSRIIYELMNYSRTWFATGEQVLLKLTWKTPEYAALLLANEAWVVHPFDDNNEWDWHHEVHFTFQEDYHPDSTYYRIQAS